MGWKLRRYKPLARKTWLKRTKFNVDRDVKLKTGGYDSKLEASVFSILRERERCGEIEDIRRQVVVDLGYNIKWRVDGSYVDLKTGRTIWVEAKGVKSARYIICLKLWRGGQGPGPLEIWMGHYLRPSLVETVTPKGKSR